MGGPAMGPFSIYLCVDGQRGYRGIEIIQTETQKTPTENVTLAKVTAKNDPPDTGG
jgi:hypothetical protein